MNPLRFLGRLFRRGTGRQPAAPDETEAQTSAREYWQREVSADKQRRGSADPRRKQ